MLTALHGFTGVATGGGCRDTSQLNHTIITRARPLGQNRAEGGLEPLWRAVPDGWSSWSIKLVTRQTWPPASVVDNLQAASQRIKNSGCGGKRAAKPRVPTYRDRGAGAGAWTTNATRHS